MSPLLIYGIYGFSPGMKPPLIANRFIISLRAIDRAEPLSRLSQACPTAQCREQHELVEVINYSLSDGLCAESATTTSVTATHGAVTKMCTTESGEAAESLGLRPSSELFVIIS